MRCSSIRWMWMETEDEAELELSTEEGEEYARIR